MTREVLAGLVGRSASWVKAVETGRLHTPKLDMLLRLAEALDVRDLSQLITDPSLDTTALAGPGHSRLPALHAAVNALPDLTERPAPPLARLRTRIDQAWATRHASPHHRDALGRLLPELIADTRLAVHQADDRTTRCRAQALMSEVYTLAHFFVVHQGDQDLLWRVADRSLVAAHDSGGVHAIGVASAMMTMVLREVGEWDAADGLTHRALGLLRGHLGPDEVLAVYGSLLYEYAFTAARRGKVGVAWGHWDSAEQVSDRLPSDYFHPIALFSPQIMSVLAVSVAVECRSGGEAVRQGERRAARISSYPRHARHGIEQARAYRLDGRPEAALSALESAYATGPDTVRYHTYARRLLVEELDSRDARQRRRAAALAERIGLPPT